LVLGGCRLLPASRAIPSSGTVIGLSTFAGETNRPIGLDLNARLRHLAVTGPTGVGKSTLLTQMVLQDAEAGSGIVVIDPKGDLVDTIAERLPASRLEDVIILDPADDARPVGYNPLASTPDTRELVVEQVLGVMRAIWEANWGPRTDDILRGCLLSLSAIPKLTLCEVPALLTDDAFRQRVMAYVDDTALEQFWATFQAWSPADRAQATAPVLNKTRALTMRPRLRGILGQADGAVDFNRLIRDRRILLVNLASGRIGTEAAYLLGALLFAGLWDAVSAQALLPRDQRATVMAYVDEFQHVVALPTPAETILAEARAYGLGLTLAHQHLGQLDKDLQHATLANARSKVVFQTSQADARVFAQELGGGLTPEDLQGIAGYEAVVSLFAGGAVQPPATIRTTPLAAPQRSAAELRGLSRQRYGVDRADVESAMKNRQRGSRRHGPTPVGRTRKGQS
jgi:energy-coupling factor transporter ATP-binding protein EcfA2